MLRKGMSSTFCARLFCYANYQDVLDKGWVDYTANNDKHSWSRFSHHQEGFEIILECENPIAELSNSHYEIYVNNQLLFRSNNIKLKNILSMSFNEILDSVKLERQLILNGFEFINNKFILKRKLMNDIIFYVYDKIFYAKFKNKIYYLSDPLLFDFDKFENYLTEKEILGRNLKRRRLKKRLG